jgi:hypothetical protein
MLRKSEGIRKGVRCLDQYVMHAKLRKGSHNYREINDSIENS